MMAIPAALTDSAAWRWLSGTLLRRHPAANPSAPIPYTLTPKAAGFLARTRHPIELFGITGENGDGWACGRCGSAWFGSVPADGHCPDCADLTAAELAESEAQARWEQEAEAAWWETAAVVEDYAAWKAANYPEQAGTDDDPVCAECGRDWPGCECWKLDASRPATTTEIYDTGWEN